MPKRVLLTKLASMGDLIHLLPALTDAKAAYPEITFDWVIDKNFQEIASWHPAVHKKIVTNHRKWRSSLLDRNTHKEIKIAIKELKQQPYELIIDAQGNLKSAFISLFASGKIAGFDGSSVPEWGAHFLYHKKIMAAKTLHAIDRLRILLAKSLDYPIPTTPIDYGIQKERLIKPSLPLPSSYLVFVPIASHPSKLCPEEFWKELIHLTLPLNLPILIPSGSKQEEERAKRLCSHPLVTPLPRLSLSEVAYVIHHAKALLCLDTGLSHIAAALGTPNLTLYGPTDPTLIGTTGINQHHLLTSSLSTLSAKEAFNHFLPLLKNS